MPKARTLLDKARMFLAQSGKDTYPVVNGEIFIARTPSAVRVRVARDFPRYPNPELSVEEFYGPYLPSQERLMRNAGDDVYRLRYWRALDNGADAPAAAQIDHERAFSEPEVIERRALRGLTNDGLSWY